MLSKHFEDLENFLSLLKNYFDIIGTSEHKIIKGSKKSAANLPGYTFCVNETETLHGGTVCFVSNNLIYKLGPDLRINKHRRLQSTVIELIFPNKKNIICVTNYKHPGMKISDFNNEYLTPLLAKILQEKKCLLIGDFNINLLNTDTYHNASDFYNILSSNSFIPYILQPTRLAKNSKTLIDNIFLNSIEFNTFSGNLTSQILDHLPQFLILKGFYHKTFINVFERNYRFFNYDEFKNDLKDVPSDNILSLGDISASLALIYFLQE